MEFLIKNLKVHLVENFILYTMLYHSIYKIRIPNFVKTEFLQIPDWNSVFLGTF